MFDGQAREADLKSVESLLALVREHVAATGEVQLYPVADGDEGRPPKGMVNLSTGGLDRERCFFNERSFYRVTAAPA